MLILHVFQNKTVSYSHISRYTEHRQNEQPHKQQQNKTKPKYNQTNQQTRLTSTNILTKITFDKLFSDVVYGRITYIPVGSVEIVSWTKTKGTNVDIVG